VTYISLDRSVAGTLDYTAAAVDAPLAWSYGLDGTGVGIAVIDSGVYSHPDLASRVVYRQSFIGGGVQFDDYGHGTHVAGIAAGNGKVSNGPGSFRSLRGIASNANILDLRVLDKNGMSNDSVIIAAIASYSSKGPTYIDLTVKPDVVAPGNLVVSLLAPGSTLQSMYPGNAIAPSYYSTSTNPATAGYFRLSGTSMATPVVRGAVALMLQKNPGLTPDTVKARLMKTATKNFPLASVAVDPTTGTAYPSTYDIFTIGSGYLDVTAALPSTGVAQTSAASPSVVYNSLTQTAYLQSNSSTIWGTNAVWGDNTWGDTNGAGEK
jgi:serine protease AprX